MQMTAMLNRKANRGEGESSRAKAGWPLVGRAPSADARDRRSCGLTPLVSEADDSACKCPAVLSASRQERVRAKAGSAVIGLAGRLLLLQCLAALTLTAGSLPRSWWRGRSAERVLAQAETITRALPYFHGSKARLLNNPTASIEFFRRRLPGGEGETKYVWHEGRVSLTDYRLESGSYTFAAGKLLRLRYSTDTIEPSLAAKRPHPYDYSFLKPQTVGTNECLVVARVATPQFVEALKSAAYPSYASAARRKRGVLEDPIRFIPSETDTYIREYDGVIIGRVKKNDFGRILDDKLYDVVEVGRPLPAADFALPAVSVQAATNIAQLLHIIGAAQYRLLHPKRVWVRAIMIGMMVVSLGVFTYLAKFRRGRPPSGGPLCHKTERIDV